MIGRRRAALALLFGLVSAGCTSQEVVAPPVAAVRAPSPAQSLRSSGEAEPIPAEATEHFVWREQIESPQPTATTTADDEQLLRLCDSGDAALNKVALRMARREAADLPPFDMAQVAFALRSEGAPYVWPRAWSLQGASSVADTATRMRRWLSSFGDGGERRCGVATVRRGNRTVVAALALDALADLRPLPTRASAGQWLTVEAQMLVPTSDAKVIILAPHGPPHPVLTSFNGRMVRARFAADRPGQWTVQVLATVDGGPRPVVESTLYVDEAPPQTFHANPVPGEELVHGAPDERTAMYLLLDAARQREQLRPLRRDHSLDAVAQAHADAMHRAGRVGHDVGNGDPRSRVEEAGIVVSATGENVAHAANLLRAHRALWASPSHRSNVLHERFNAVGIGVSKDKDGSVWVCEVFGTFRWGAETPLLSGR